MKKWGFLLVFALFLFFIFNILPIFQDKVEVQIYEQNDNATAENIQKIEITEEQVYQGNLLLVNNEYSVQQVGIKSNIVNLFTHKELTTRYELINSEIKLSEEIAEKFSEMIAAAEEDGVSNFLISSGYRDLDEQSRLYEEMGADYALPAGHSEHNLGLALDVGSTQMKMDEAPEGEWIEENSWKYGFILRYPLDKTDVTGIQYEPWHIRYVGLPHSAIMQEMNLALEEYSDYLKEEKSISVSVDGKKYTISYYPISQNETIKVEVPANEQYEISGNNIDGVIVTTFS
ncbi:VanY-A/VanY-F/VanY-M family D-Ala-D-Ala carboxypeptidase [Brevibacillus laterosporus]|uniref:VanY-A/VanY-F/VanY-M family D-Ala-D-Ala carboxypeptidase n=1 Tax=Brevibacillus laterosporus TaxID=1465 RepID=UPI000CE431F4|nr:VanY-A/VanY-F/VanY-M family D-Ala-D-Ala carboxypeptidase [Brevibacillus laterosporus]MED1664911.1 VanY-A/VanY-F/VanY-M family D-Ala-D-Ala carboxypeptidase [Brevibacillus laterosporus]MED1671493.1 VanY-A/VanY-F/VanY-M family D-Ala-D-Ala carboxypeptidase [Brevibacillus laterosporus]MED1717478.1 VanY-A/VanY-F/VanY-M family D-Ala-D-Ala carboxypeptidase [Brevibacillus laterosporus]PPA87576.1 VanY-A/VanY-F/VanY-M family D-Ala-D-Ala carboxypeptidase [Brevibacillus laterosporus]